MNLTLSISLFLGALFVALGILQKLNLNPKFIFPIVCITLGFKENGKWKLGWVKWGHSADQSLFYNGIFCLRLMAPFCLGIGIRWAGANPAAREFLHIVIGWKLNGELTLEFRIQSDIASSAGATAPNVGQAWGWNAGTK